MRDFLTKNGGNVDSELKVPERLAASRAGVTTYGKNSFAYLDEAGYLYIVDRIKDLVIRGGENIGCGAVEAALLEHPLVLEASVYAVPDERLGEEVGATVYTITPVSDDELRSFLAPALDRGFRGTHARTRPHPTVQGPDRSGGAD